MSEILIFIWKCSKNEYKCTQIASICNLHNLFVPGNVIYIYETSFIVLIIGKCMMKNINDENMY